MKAQATCVALAVLLVTGCNTILGTEDVTGPNGGDDASVDATERPPDQVRLRGPMLGAATGSVHAVASRRPQLSWYPAATATRYELQVDDTCVIASFRTCLFPSPEQAIPDINGTKYDVPSDLGVSMTPPVGRRHYWRVRACNAVGCGDWSDVWYLDVGRLVDDVNGDGYGDVAVGIASGTGQMAAVGRAHVILGQGGSGSPTVVAFSDPRAASDGRFGSTVAMVGDLNADGYGDLAIGAWNTPRASHLGWVYVYTGRGTWPSAVTAEDGGYGLASTDAADDFGAAIVGGGDVNGDGYADFAVTALRPELPTPRPGRVYVNYGRPTLPAAQLGSDRHMPDPLGDASGAFGWSLSMSDINEDGYGDVLVGSIGASIFAGSAAMYFGGRDTTAPPISVTSENVRVVSSAVAPAFFGAASVTCRGSGSGPTTAIAAPAESAPGQGAGRVRLYRGRTSWPMDIATDDAAVNDPSGAFRASFGTDLACGDVTSDGRTDLVASAPTPDDDGVVFLFSDIGSLPANPLATLSGGTGIVGHRVKVTDFNGDGIDDVIASRLRGPLTPAGAVLVWFGRQAWPSAITFPDLTVPNPSGMADERFGESMD